MNTDVDGASDSENCRIAIRAYARRLCEALGQYIGVVSQTSDPISRSAYQTATLQQYDRQELTGWGAAAAQWSRRRSDRDRE